ncbi:MAG: hypothetical protein HDS04_07030 [Bacteroides sp.]|nr:hypothetical protein [Bacteroidales bacterium]MBD5326412.1 hypothetical protein [Bacteroides sp.]
MNTISFIIIIGLISAGMIYTLLAVLNLEPVAKAGKVNKFCWKYHSVPTRNISEINVDGKHVDVSRFKRLYVCGNSMKKYGIHSDQQVFVQLYSDEQKSAINAYPVLALTISNAKWESKYKLRKFVAYVSDLDCSEQYWTSVYDNHSPRISISKELFVSDCMRKSAKISPRKKNERFVLSETYDEEKQRETYSIHEISTIYGQVKYAI